MTRSTPDEPRCCGRCGTELHELGPGEGWRHADHRLDADHTAWWDRGVATAAVRRAIGRA